MGIKGMSLAAFRETRLPTYLALGSTFGMMTSTEVVELSSGYDTRTVLWPQHRHTGALYYHNRTLAQLRELDAHFRVSRGKAMGWRFRHDVDYTAVNQFVGQGDGSRVQFQLQKIYDSGVQADQYVRMITKPVGVNYPIGNAYNSVQLYLDGTLQAGGYTLDYSTGLVTMSTPPASGQTLTWSGEFDVPCRYDTDHLALSLVVPWVGQTPRSVPICELLPYPTFPPQLAT